MLLSFGELIFLCLSPSADLPQYSGVDPNTGKVDPNVRIVNPEAHVEVTVETSDGIMLIDMPKPDPCTTQDV